MFGRPRCPIDPRKKAWIDTRFASLIDRFGVDALRGADVLLPTRTFFPEVFEEDWDAADICKRLAGHLGLSADDVGVVIHEDGSEWANEEGFEHVGGACYRAPGGRVDVHVYEALATDPERLVAILGGELLRHAACASGTADKAFASQVLELHTVTRGLGVFSANAQLRETGRVLSGTEEWEQTHLGGLGPHDYGYALALFAWLRRENKPGWISALRPDAATPCRASLKYLQKTGDALLKPDGTDRRPAALSESQVQQMLSDGSEADRVAALWSLRERKEATGDALTALLANVEHASASVRCEALWTVRACDVDPADCLACVTDALLDPSEDVQAAAINALTKVCDDHDVLRRELAPLLERGDIGVVLATALALSELGERATDFLPDLTAALPRALATMDPVLLLSLLVALQKISGDARGLLVGSSVWDDPEHAGLLEEALEALEEDERTEVAAQPDGSGASCMHPGGGG